MSPSATDPSQDDQQYQRQFTHTTSVSQDVLPPRTERQALRSLFTKSEASKDKTAALLPLVAHVNKPRFSGFRRVLKAQNAKKRFLHLNGWRAGVSWCTGTATVVLLINIIWTVGAVAIYGVKNGTGTVHNGSCDKARKLSLWLHLLINILSTLLLGASNYCMQCLAAPTREEVDKAHSQHKWVDIGVPSVRNLFHISRTRSILWLLLGMSGIPLHLLYNSAVFSTLAANSYDVFAVSLELATAPQEEIRQRIGALSTQTKQSVSRASLDALAGVGAWENLTNIECIRAYGQSFVSSHSTLALVSSSLERNSPVLALDSNDDILLDGNNYNWMCTDNSMGYQGESAYCDVEKLYGQAASWNISYTSDRAISVAYCLSRKAKEHCSVQFSVLIMSVVIISNAMKAACMFMTLWRHRRAPLVTLGDAIQSFLRSNDLTTAGMCLAGKIDFQNRQW